MSIAPLNLVDLFRAEMRTSAEADALNLRLQSELKFDFRYQPARVALAMSLAEPTPPPPAADLLGKPIRGETLFGQEEGEMALWVGLMTERAGGPLTTRRAFQEVVAAHWARGSALLGRGWSKWNGSPQEFLAALARSAR